MRPSNLVGVLLDTTRRIWLTGTVLSAMLALSSGEYGYDITTELISLPIGQSTVDLVVHRADERGLAYLNLHDDEDTSVDAALALVRTHGGVVFELQHGGSRNLTFRLNDSSYTVDPNRIFTDSGIDLTLNRHGSTNTQAHEAVRSFSDSLLSLVGFREMAVVVTIHNNSEGGYSALSYDENGDLSSDARSVHLVPDEDPDDFFFVTTDALYDTLRARDANVVLQDNLLAQDDGSLSVLAGRDGIPYVNVEAQHDHVDVQRGMLALLHSLFVTESTRR